MRIIILIKGHEYSKRVAPRFLHFSAFIVLLTHRSWKVVLLMYLTMEKAYFLYLTRRGDSLDTLPQVALHYVCRDLESFTPSVSDVTFTKTQSDVSLPVHLTSVSCYGFDINCTHRKYTSYTSMDISISCNSKDDSSNSGKSTRNSTNGVESSRDSTSIKNMSIASLSIAVIFASAFIVLVIVLIVRQRTKK